MKAKYQIVPSKAGVGFDGPMKALSMLIQKHYLGNIVLALTAVILSKNIFEPNPFVLCSMCHYCEGNVSNCTIKSCGRS